MKLVTNTQVTVNGVVEGIGGRDENCSGGFERGGWARAPFDREAMAFLNGFYQRADAFLFGRRTFDLFASSWDVKGPGSVPIAEALNAKPKYVALSTLTDPRWANTTVLAGDLAAAIGELKARSGGELQVHGSGTLIRWLIENDLVDEMNRFQRGEVQGQVTER